MNSIPLCHRWCLKPKDVTFIEEVLGATQSEKNALLRLLVDEDTRDEILDQERLFKALIHSPRHYVDVSPHLYFYVLVRHGLKEDGLDYPELADYIASVLEEFAHQRSWKAQSRKSALFYSVDLVKGAQSASGYDRFYIYAFAGNHYLVLAGLFPQHLRGLQKRRGVPAIDYYDSVASYAYRAARDHPLAQEFSLCEVFDHLANHFGETRKTLNRFSERLCMLN